MDQVINRQVNRNALEASAEAAAAQMAREGISQFEQTPEQRERVEAIRQYHDAQYAEADLAVSLLSRAANVGRGEAIVDLLSREHAYLLNEIAFVVLKAVSTRIRDSGDYVDGRINARLAEFASQNTIPLKRAR